MPFLEFFEIRNSVASIEKENENGRYKEACYNTDDDELGTLFGICFLQ